MLYLFRIRKHVMITHLLILFLNFFSRVHLISVIFKMGQTFVRQKVTLSSIPPSPVKEGSDANHTKVESVQYGSELRECGTLFSECNVANTIGS